MAQHRATRPSISSIWCAQPHHGADGFRANIIECVQIDDQPVGRQGVELPPQGVGLGLELRLAEHPSADCWCDHERGDGVRQRTAFPPSPGWRHPVSRLGSPTSQPLRTPRSQPSVGSTCASIRSSSRRRRSAGNRRRLVQNGSSAHRDAFPPSPAGRRAAARLCPARAAQCTRDTLRSSKRTAEFRCRPIRVIRRSIK